MNVINKSRKRPYAPASSSSNAWIWRLHFIATGGYFAPSVANPVNCTTWHRARTTEPEPETHGTSSFAVAAADRARRGFRNLSQMRRTRSSPRP